MNEIDYAARVAKGAALLDEKRPGWEREIDLSTLNIASPSTCVTAQLSGVSWFSDGASQFGLTLGNDGTYIPHGFDAEDVSAPEAYGLPDDARYGDREAAQNAAYATLSTLWRDLITSRLAVPTDGA